VDAKKIQAYPQKLRLKHQNHVAIDENVRKIHKREQRLLFYLNLFAKLSFSTAMALNGHKCEKMCIKMSTKQHTASKRRHRKRKVIAFFGGQLAYSR